MPEEPIHFTPESEYQKKPIPATGTNRLLKLATILLAVAVGILVSLYLYVTSLNNPPEDFPVNSPIIISPGTSVKDITEILQQENVVRSSSLLYYILVLSYDPTSVKASTYVFEKPYSSSEIAVRLTKGDFDTDLVRFTHIEGERVTLLAERAARLLPNFDITEFVATSTQYEGKLFPETYFIPVDYTAEELLTLMLSTFDERIKTVKDDIDTSPLSLEEILVLASLIEREANSLESMKLISGVYHNRLEIDMPLQADASIEYVLDKPLSELVPEDLEIDSPYNTYLNTGLPPTPIGNPGFDAINAVLHPTESDYFYYITGKDGEFYYAKTYAEHKLNIERYLR